MTHAQEIQGLKNMMGRADQMNAALHQQAGYNRF